MIKSPIKSPIIAGAALVLLGYASGSYITSRSTDEPTSSPACELIDYHTIMSKPGNDPLLYIDYIAMDNGYGQWTLMSPNSATPLGYATQEDSLIYNHLECIYSQPEY